MAEAFSGWRIWVDEDEIGMATVISEERSRRDSASAVRMKRNANALPVAWSRQADCLTGGDWKRAAIMMCPGSLAAS